MPKRINHTQNQLCAACRHVVLQVAVCVLLGCGQSLQAPPLGTLYSRAAAYHDQYRNPVIVIPGILGSRLVDPLSGTVVWGAFGGDYANPETQDGAQLLALPMQEGVALHSLRDHVVSNGALDRLRIDLLGLPVRLGAYAQILATLGAGGYRDEQLAKAGAVSYGNDHYTCFQFDYDWRRDNVENAQRLYQFILEKRIQVRKEIEKRFKVQNPDVRFDIVAHSMGGLVTRYMLLYGDQDLPEDGSVPQVTWAGAHLVRRAILVGTPNAGSVDSLTSLVYGLSFAPGLPRVEPAVIGSMPSVYQLLPRSRHQAVIDAADKKPVADLLDPELWKEMNWGLASPNQDPMLAKLLPDVADPAQRRQIAMEHLNKCLSRAQQFCDAMDVPATTPPGLELHLFAGDAVPTEALLEVDRQTGQVRATGYAPGDGTVLRSSTLMDERLDGQWAPVLRSPIDWRGVHFLFTDHLGLTKDPGFSDNVLHLLLESPM